MRHLGLLIARSVLGGYLAVHGAQKLFGAFGGHGVEATAAGFGSMGLRPAKAMAVLAGLSEMGGGVLTATGIADPLGPVAVAGTMAVAVAVHREHGPLAQNGGFELPLTNLALAVALMASPGKLRIGLRLPSSLARLAVIGGIGAAAVATGQILLAQPGTRAKLARPDAKALVPAEAEGSYSRP
ncbi:MAG: DoxX family protein [Actinobacteria bacterium]|nr:DoxX family protein [Actinomycetota bacterium]